MKVITTARCSAFLIIMVLLFAGVRLALSREGKRGAAVIAIDTATTYQRIDGFGSSFGGFAVFERGYFDEVVPEGVCYRMSPELRRKLVRIAIKELGVSHLRMWISGGVEEKNDNHDPHDMSAGAFHWEGESHQPQAKDFRANRRNGIAEWVDFLREARPLGLEYWIPTPSGFPAWLEQMIRCHEPNCFEEYAEWAAAHLMYLKRAGLEAPYWSMVNEPDVSRKGWKAPEMWIPWIQATGRRFRKEGLRTKIMFPDSAGVFDAMTMTDGVMKDDEVRQYIGALAYHHYRSSKKGPQPWLELASQRDPSGELFDRLTGGIHGMAERARRYGVPSWETEAAYYPDYTKDLSEWAVGMGRANEIYYEITFGASAYEGMLLIAPDAIDTRYGTTTRNEGHHIILRTDGKRVVYWAVTRDTGAVIAQWARFVRPGDIRIGASSDDPALRVTAFKSDQNQRYVAVVINNSAATQTASLQLSKAAWDVRAARAFRTDVMHMLAETNISFDRATGAVSVALPAKSITTVVWARHPVPPARFQTSGLPAELFSSFRYDHKRYVEIQTRQRRDQPVSQDDREYMDRANAWREELNEIHRTKNPPRASTGLVPLTELGTRKYKGQEGGLYPGGANVPPPEHLQAGLAAAQQVVPRDRDGRASTDGSIVLLSVGMSNATMEFRVFKKLADSTPEKNPRLVIVDGAQGSHTAELTSDPNGNFWKVVDQRLAAAGVTPLQVQAAWVKQASPWGIRLFPEEPTELQRLLMATLQVMASRFPNLKIAYLSSRSYGGYAEIALSPEPHAYESAFAVKWLIGDQIAGKPELNCDLSRGTVKAPWLAWGPYLWADGTRGRKNGLMYTRSDYLFDGTHPSATGAEKVATHLLTFLKSNPTSRPWFMAAGGVSAASRPGR